MITAKLERKLQQPEPSESRPKVALRMCNFLLNAFLPAGSPQLTLKMKPISHAEHVIITVIKSMVYEPLR